MIATHAERECEAAHGGLHLMLGNVFWQHLQIRELVGKLGGRRSPREKKGCQRNPSPQCTMCHLVSSNARKSGDKDIARAHRASNSPSRFLRYTRQLYCLSYTTTLFTS